MRFEPGDSLKRHTYKRGVILLTNAMGSIKIRE